VSVALLVAWTYFGGLQKGTPMSFTVDDSIFTAGSNSLSTLSSVLWVVGVIAVGGVVVGILFITRKEDRKHGLWLTPVALVVVVVSLSYSASLASNYSKATAKFTEAFEQTYGVELVKEAFVNQANNPIIPTPNEPYPVLLTKDDSFYTTTVTFVGEENEWTALAPAGSAAKLTALDQAFAEGSLVAEEPLVTDR
jgi:glucan phosphoethanolaminetransferase (alkaline phosphatase superfamily)